MSYHDTLCEINYLKSKVRRLNEELNTPIEKKISKLETELNLERALRKAADAKIKELEKIIGVY